ncbi:cell division protein FtsB [Glaciimonas sp. PAMC28666]|nr:cell division protein FtsB [Glaciimonas sp. PAMC28666]QRX81555.1 cell division protein FtsB [Glaciimonas sp. PAMC28666]
MRLIAICLTVLLMLIQYPLWLGKGGWLRVSDMGQQVTNAHDKIDELKARNAKLDSEVHDLKEGTGAIEERARSELGMIKQDEIFVQVLDPNNTEVLSTLKEAQMLSDKVGAAIPAKTPPEEKRSGGPLGAKSTAKPVSKQAQAQTKAKAAQYIEQQVRD